MMDEPWNADDGTTWLYVDATDDWTGWVPDENGCWILSPEDMDRHYPEHPALAPPKVLHDTPDDGAS